ncbi:Dienelactone hydrolase [Sinosporangium album]|uniref:Dienelactone hydrolase n=1 Tax=Sinosporangium album TaxID=504805 RepID=A0A1G7ZUA1_9ACTN|nr:dienelactone hydrolase family protein [Sinosporangium album]SDH12285.1 Dienelactone hydrolase [Sinosporangium album]
MTAGEFSYRDEDLTLTGFLAVNGGEAAKRPGVVIAPDAAGVSDHMKRHAARFADLGYVALILDMYGAPVSGLHDGMKYVGPLKADPVTLRRRARAGLDALAAHPQVDPARLAVVGYCFGGTVALELARDGADIAVAASLHGDLVTKAPAQAGAVKPTVLVYHGGADPLCPLDTIPPFEREMDEAGADWLVTVYGSAKHSFTNPGADLYGVPAAGYNKLADERSWADLTHHLGVAFGAAR